MCSIWYWQKYLSPGIETACREDQPVDTTEMNKNEKIVQDDKAQVINAIGGEANITTPHFN